MDTDCASMLLSKVMMQFSLHFTRMISLYRVALALL